MKLLVSVNTCQLDPYIEHGADGFLLPLTSFSTDFETTYCLEEMIMIRKKYPQVCLFVVMNAMIFNQDLKEVEKILKTLETYHFDGIFFYDWAIYKIHLQNQLKTPLVWNQTYMVTNQATANFLYEKGISYGVLSSEITKDEIKNITESPMKFFMYLVGFLPVGLSRRKLLTHFYKTLGKNGKKKLLVREDSTHMPFLFHETLQGTSILYGKCFNAAPFYKELSSMSIAYGILKQDYLEKSIFLKVLSFYANEKDLEELIVETGNLIGRNTGFLARKTVFKVKKEKSNERG